MDVILYIIIGGVAAWIGWHVRGFILLANLSKNPEHIIKILEEIKKINDSEARGEIDVQGLDVTGTEIRIEQVNGAVYAYVADNNSFLAQGSTLEEALKIASERFPNQKFWHNESKQFNQTA